MTLSPALRAALMTPFSPLRRPFTLLLDAGLSGRVLANTGFAGTGTVTQVGTALTGVGTAFTGEVKVGDALSGTLISGNVVSIASATALTLDDSNSGAGAAFTITPTPGVSDRLSQVNDLSGRGNNVVQATRALQAAYLTGASGINGLPCWEFDAINDFLRVTLGAEITQPITVYVGCSFGSTAATRLAYDGVATDKRCTLFQYDAGNGSEVTLYAGTIVKSGDLATGVQMYSAVFSGAASTLRQNAVTILSGSTVGTQGVGGITVGAQWDGASPLGGKMFMLGVILGADSIAQQQQMEQYYRTRGYW